MEIGLPITITEMDTVNEEQTKPVKKLGKKPYADRNMVRKYIAGRVNSTTFAFITEVRSGMEPNKSSTGRAIDRIVETILKHDLQIFPE